MSSIHFSDDRNIDMVFCIDCSAGMAVIPAVSTALFIKKQGKCCQKCWKTERECEKAVDKKLTMCYNMHNSTDFCKIHDFGGNNNGT